MKAEQKLQAKKESRDALYNTLGTFFYFACQWLLTVAVVRLSGYEDAGIFSMVLSVTNVFYCISMYGVRNYQVSDIKGEYTDSEYIQFRHLCTLIAFILFALCLLFLKLDWKTLLSCWIYIFYKFEESYTDVFFGIFQKHDGYRQILISYVLKGIFSLGTFCLGLIVTKSLFWTLLINVIFMGAIMLLYDVPFLARNNARLFTKKFSMKRLLKACFPLMLYSMLVPCLNFISRYAIEARYGSNQLGYFSSITMVLSVLMVLMNSIFVTFIAQMAALYFEKKYRKLLRMLIAVIGGFVILLVLGEIAGFLLGDFFFGLVFGEEILPYMYLLPMTIVCAVILSAVTFISCVLTSFRKNNWVLYGNAISVIFCILTMNACINVWQMNGALICMSVGLLLSFIVLLCMSLWCIARGRKEERGIS